MVIGVLQVELHIGDAVSLKDKRQVVASLKQRLHRHHAVAVAEVDRMDNHQVAVLGIVTVTNSAEHADSVMGQIVESLRRSRQFVLTDHQTELMTGH